MDLVVDANVLLACFKPSSVTRELIANENLHLFSTEFQMKELKAYSEEISAKYSLSAELIEHTMDFLESHVEVTPKEEYKEQAKVRVFTTSELIRFIKGE